MKLFPALLIEYDLSVIEKGWYIFILKIILKGNFHQRVAKQPFHLTKYYHKSHRDEMVINKV